MPQFSSELLTYGLIIGVFLLFNYVVQLVAKKARQARAAAEASVPVSRPTPTEAQASAAQSADEYAWGRAPGAPPAAEAPEEIRWGPMPAAPPIVLEHTRTLEHTGAIEAPVLQVPAPPAEAPRRTPIAPHRLFATQQDLRRAIVIMTVLGPCRALDPPEYR